MLTLLTQRAPRALSLLAAYAPEAFPGCCARGLRGFALRPKAAARAARSAGRASASPLLPPPPAPLAFAEELVGGEQMMVASLEGSPGVAARRPFYLTLQEHAQLLRFLTQAPTDTPQLLLLVGPTKSGKSRVALGVIPRMLTALHASAPRTRRVPVPFSFTFPLGVPAERASQHLVQALLAFARARGCRLAEAPGGGLMALPRVAAAVAQHTHASGGELWILLDELGAPIVASSPSDAEEFTVQLKSLVLQCCPYARIVGTGSGMLALLAAIRDARPNGFALWDAAAHVSLGRAPRSAAAALVMAQGLHASYAAEWPLGVARVLTPERVLGALAPRTHGELTSPRPALVAYLLSLLGDARSGECGEALLARAQQVMVDKLQEESLVDAAVALQRLALRQVRALRALAEPGGGRLPEASDRMALFARLLCEESPPHQLMAPYSALLRSWVTRDGRVTVHSTRGSTAGGGLHLSPLVRSNLKAVSAYAPLLTPAERAALSRVLLHVFARNGLGVEVEKGGVAPGAALRAPESVAELGSVPAVRSLLAALNREADEEGGVAGGLSPSYAALQRARRGGAAEQALFMQGAGLSLLLWMRSAGAHVFLPTELGRAGLTCAVVGAAVFAAVDAMVELRGGRAFMLGEHGVLLRLRPAAGQLGEPGRRSLL